MARAIHKLKVTHLERGAKYRRAGMYGDGGGLYLLVKHEDARSWVFRYMLDRQARAMGLGAYPDVALASARDDARRAREHLEQGKDPLAERDSERARQRAETAKTVTFRACAETFIEDQLYAQSLRPKDFVAVAAYGQGGPGYVCTDVAYGEGGYEPVDSLVGPPLESDLKAAIARLLA